MLPQAEDPLRSFEPCAQLVHIDRLRDEVIGARYHDLEVALFSTGRGDQKEIGVAVGGPRAHSPAELGTIHLGHLPVGNDDREIAELQVGPRLAPVLGFGHLVAEALEHRAQRQARDGVVFSEEQVHRSAPGRIRTSDQQLRRLLLYPPELRARRLCRPQINESRAAGTPAIWSVLRSYRTM